MSLTPAMIDAMVETGCTAEQIAAVVKASMAETEARQSEKRANDRQRQRRHRASRDVTVTDRDTQIKPLDKKDPHTPKKIKPNPPPIVPPSDVDQAIELWNEMAGGRGLAQVVKLTERRRKAIKARLDEFGLDGWRKALAAVAGSPFHCGENDRGWRADLDFVSGESKFVALLELPPPKEQRRAKEWEFSGPC